MRRVALPLVGGDECYPQPRTLPECQGRGYVQSIQCANGRLMKHILGAGHD